MVSLRCSLFADTNITNLLQRENHQVLARTGVVYEKSGSRHTKPAISCISETTRDITKLLLTTYVKIFLSIAVKMCDLELPLSEIQGH